MSTRFTLDYGENFHLYVGWIKSHVISLELQGAHFEARPNCVTVDIPLELWNRLRVKTVNPNDYWDDDDDDGPSPPKGQP